jgi:hypothetical protein
VALGQQEGQARKSDGQCGVETSFVVSALATPAQLGNPDDQGKI